MARNGRHDSKDVFVGLVGGVIGAIVRSEFQDGYSSASNQQKGPQSQQ
jgi:hypothetical protein